MLETLLFLCPLTPWDDTSCWSSQISLFHVEMLTSVLTGLDEDVTRDREEHEDRDEDKTDQSESEEDDDDNVYVDDSAPPVETPYIKNSTEELGQVCLMWSRITQ